MTVADISGADTAPLQRLSAACQTALYLHNNSVSRSTNINSTTDNHEKAIAVHIEIDTSGQVGRAVLCPPLFCQRARSDSPAGAHGVTRPTFTRSRFPAAWQTVPMLTETAIVLVLSAVIVLAAGNLLAAGAKNYQVTGPVLEVNPTYLVVQKGDE
jgi:hypothetical protein